MRTIVIVADVTLTASEETIRAYEAEREAEAAAIRWEENARRMLDEAAEAGDWGFYSDLYKDLYGFRPRW